MDEAFVTCVEVARGAGDEMADVARWRLASELACHHRRARLEPLLSSGAIEADDRPFLAAVIHERVLRGEPWDDSDAAHRCLEALRDEDHRLGYMPLHQTIVEAAVEMPTYGVEGSMSYSMSYSMPFGPTREPERRTWRPEEIEPLELETHVRPEEHTDIGAAFDRWCEASNGREVSRIGTPAEPHTEISPGLLVGLGMPCLEDDADTSLWEISAAEAFGIFFSAAAWGGAYGGARYGAHGRRDAWQSFGVMMGASWGGYDSRSEYAERCHWARFESSSEWFEQVAWDVGVVCLTEKGTTVRAVAATDTD
jgi:hypothetical protein